MSGSRITPVRQFSRRPQIRIRDACVEIVARRHLGRPDAVAVFDLQDLPRVSQRRWHYCSTRRRFVAYPNGISLAAFILGPGARATYLNGDTHDCRRANLRQANRFGSASVVKTWRRGVLAGYEVWRHLDNSRSRPKARLWFGLNRWRLGSSKRSRALALARAAAARLDAMTLSELRAWWDSYRLARLLGQPVDRWWREEPAAEQRLDHSDLAMMSHAYAADR